MSFIRKNRKQRKNENEVILSEDIDTTESYAGVGQQNIVNNDNTCEKHENSEFISIKTNLNNKNRSFEQYSIKDFKVSPELEFNFPIKSKNKFPSKKIPVGEKNIKTNSARLNRKKSIENATSLPVLTVKKSGTERDTNDLKSKSINHQIEKIENRKEKLTLSEKKSRMDEIRSKAKLNWSNFKTDIDFVKLIETNDLVLPVESTNLINDEKVLNGILNELSLMETENFLVKIPVTPDNQISTNIEKSSTNDVDNQENIIEFISAIKPMLKSYITTTLIEDAAMSLKQILFNSTCRCWGTEWYRQNFEFYPIDSELSFAMIQRMEGPNSVMCAVQAEFLIEAIFHCDASVNWICNLKRHRNKLLAATLARIISRCRSSKSDNIRVCLLDVNLKGRSFGTVKQDGITECIVVYEIKSNEELQQFILHHISQFSNTFNPGLILLVVSCLLTRGLAFSLQELKKNEKRLISPLGFPREELMNLLLTGKLVSHHFNDSINIVDNCDNYVSLTGIPSRSSVGFLSIEPHCQYCKEIGTYLKTPKYPVWLAKFEDNNYVVLYCLNGNLVNDWKTEIKFQLNLYTPLLAKRGVTKITVDSSTAQTAKVRMTEEEKRLEKEKERRHKEVTSKRLGNMSDSALKFLLDGESIEDYVNNGSDTVFDTEEQMNILEKIILIKWPNANVLLSEENINIFSLIKN